MPRKPKGLLDDFGKGAKEAAVRQWMAAAKALELAEKRAKDASSAAAKRAAEKQARGIKKSMAELGKKQNANPKAHMQMMAKKVEKKAEYRAAGGVNSAKAVAARQKKRGKSVR